MSQEWRSQTSREKTMGRFLRHRWERDSVYVLDIDHLICDPQGRRGVLLEEKHANAADRSTRITRALASRLGWWAGLLIYDTDDGSEYGELTAIEMQLWRPDGSEARQLGAFDAAGFDTWVAREFGANVKQGGGT